ncbi:YjzC family protein [candidate division KSB1 bacterium]|nr:YjzC family protein [candidate division KSB1 bacterium]
MSNKKRFNPGEKAPKSGQYKNTRTGNEVTVTRGEPMPPTPKKGQKYVIVDPTKHKR